MMDNKLKESIKSFINNVYAKDYSKANAELKKAVEYKIQERIKKAYKKDLF